MKTVQIKNLKLKNPLILAPMAGYTDLSFRLLCRRFGASLAYTEMISAAGLIRGNKKTMEMIKSNAEDKPLGIQLFGSDAKILAQAAKIAVQHGAQIIDLNCGCPVKKVTRQNAGSALMKNPDKLANIVTALTAAVDIPVTVKLRAGQDENNINIIEVVEKLKNAGLSAITLHPRTVAEPYKSRPKWELLKEIKDKLELPVIGSGGLDNADKVKQMLNQTGIDAVMLARGALGHPWIFIQTERKLSNISDSYELSLIDKIDIMKEHLSLMINHYGNNNACRLFRSHAYYYIDGWKNAARLREKLNHLTSYEQLVDILKYIT